MELIKLLYYAELAIAFFGFFLAGKVFSQPKTKFNYSVAYLFLILGFCGVFDFLSYTAENPGEAEFFNHLSAPFWTALPFGFFLMTRRLFEKLFPVKNRTLFIHLLGIILMSGIAIIHPEWFCVLKKINHHYLLLRSSDPRYFLYVVYYLAYISYLFYFLSRLLIIKNSLPENLRKVLRIYHYAFSFLCVYSLGIYLLAREFGYRTDLIFHPGFFLTSIFIYFSIVRLNLLKTYPRLELEYHQLQLVFQNSQALLNVDDLEELLRIIARNARKATRCRAIAITRYEDNAFVVRAFAGLDNPLIKKGFELAGIHPVGLRVPVNPEGFTHRLAKEKKPIILRDFYEQIGGIIPRHLARLAQLVGGIRVMVNSPLLVNQQLIGTIVYGVSREIDERELDLMEMFTQQAAQAIKKAMLLEEIRQANLELEKKVQERTRELEEARLQLLAYSRNLEEEVKKQTEKLKETHQKLVELAHLAGRAEVSAGVIHNIGNALNTAFIRLQRIEEILGNLNFSAFQDSLIQGEGEGLEQRLKTEPDFAKKLLTYLELKTKELNQLRDQLQVNFSQLKKRIEHINEIIRLQQNYSLRSGLKEFIGINQLVEDTISMMEDSISKRGVELKLELSPKLPLIYQNRNQVIQILMNLIKNALEALEENPPSNRKLKITTRRAGKNIEIIVEDNGKGIPPEHLDKIFDYGFTTKANGKGIGLHISALFARIGNGQILAQSDGPGKGARFTLILPSAQEKFLAKEVA